MKRVASIAFALGWFWLWFVFSLLPLGCEPLLEVPRSSSADAGAGEPRFEPAGCCELPSSFRFSPTTALVPPFPMMFRGDLSDYHRARLDAPTLPSTLESRRVPLGRERRGAHSWFAPLETLVPGEVYSLASSEREVVSVRIRATEVSSFRRSWPLDAEPTRLAVFCSEKQEREQTFTLPSGLTALVIPGSNRCFGLLAEPGFAPAFSPRTLFGTPLDTTLLAGTVTDAEALEPLECTGDESRFAIGCALVEDDRLTFRSPVDSYWLFSGATAGGVGVSALGRAAISGLEPESRAELSLRIFTRGGQELSADVVVRTAASRPHVVINEVLADANGREPEQEWVELYNDARDDVDLEGLRLSDSDFESGVVLPAHRLGAGDFVLLVRDDYDTNADLDVVPSAATGLVRLPALGEYGLSNSGERLTLYSSEGAVLSRVPALAARAGVSVARRSPACPDVDECFASHAEPGASPGGANVVE